MKIYTKTGDKGETALIGGKRLLKSELRLEAYGSVDELNSCLGIVGAFANHLRNQANLEPFCNDLVSQIHSIQNLLFSVGSHLACADAQFAKQLPVFDMGSVTVLELKMDEYTAALPELRNFILPGGSVLAAHLHLARTVCRRAERAVVRLHQKEPISEFIEVYLNRLSDFLFVAARYANFQQGQSDIVWKS